MSKSRVFTTISDSQIEKAVRLFRRALQQHRAELLKAAVSEVLADPEFCSELSGVVRDRVESWCFNNNVFSVVVNYSKSCREMIAAGNYVHVDRQINSGNFPISGSGSQEVVLQLVSYKRDLKTANILEDLAAKGLEVAKIEHLLAFGAKYPNVQRRYGIYALGSIWDSGGGEQVPYLGMAGMEYNKKRRLGLSGNIKFGWNSRGCRFLVISGPN